MQIGDRVVTRLYEDSDEYIVAGVMKYANDDDAVVLLATEQYIGVPINKSWCEVVSSGHETEARMYRDRYLNKFPGTLKETD